MRIPAVGEGVKIELLNFPLSTHNTSGERDLLSLVILFGLVWVAFV